MRIKRISKPNQTEVENIQSSRYSQPACNTDDHVSLHKQHSHTTQVATLMAAIGRTATCCPLPITLRRHGHTRAVCPFKSPPSNSNTWFLGPRGPHPKRHLERFIRFCKARGRDQHKHRDRQTRRQTNLHL